MRDTMFLLAFLVLTFGCWASQAQLAPQESIHAGLIQASLLSIVPESSEYDDFETTFEACLAIAGVYGFYWFKQQT